MEDRVDREGYCEQVGIHLSTISRWVAEGVLIPERVGLHGKQLFTEEDVKFGRALIYKLKERRGEYSLAQIVEIVRGERVAAQFSESPPGAPPPQ
jgi:DNA-binding transcriptional MerR regulator